MANKLNCYKYAFFGHIIYSENETTLIYLLFKLMPNITVIN